jgi:formylglycine-generating enzyme required for sulfatase activity
MKQVRKIKITGKTKDDDEELITVELPHMVKVPAGEFIMGTSDVQIGQLLLKDEWAEDWYDAGMFQIEQPQHTLTVKAFEIGTYPVTNLEYYAFVYNTGYRVPRSWGGFHYNEEYTHHPVTDVSKLDAIAYCEWLSKETGMTFRLPTEAEWERAARGIDGRIYPWGDVFDPWRCNTVESAKGITTPVGSYSYSGDSPSGAADMAGNVWEWTSSMLYPYPYDPTDGREDCKAGEKCVVRGGAWYYSRKLARCAAREGMLPEVISTSIGFRVLHPQDGK